MAVEIYFQLGEIKFACLRCLVCNDMAMLRSEMLYDDIMTEFKKYQEHHKHAST